MGLPHFTTVRSHNENFDPIYKNLFEVEIFLPDDIKDKHPDGTSLLLENAKTVNLPTYPEMETITQKYKYSTRLYLGFPTSTSLDNISVTLNINQNDAKQMFTFRMIKDWYDLVWNNEDGSTNYKRTCLGEIIIYQHDREGNIIRRITYHNCQLKGFSVGEDLTWDSTSEIQELTANFVCDYWEDYYF